MKTGIFVNFNIPYSKGGKTVPSQSQAEEILKKAKELLDAGAKGVGIIYSANYGQTRKIEQVYFAGGWNTQTGGANQADVIREMESLLGTTPHQQLQGRMRIIPITTMNAYAGDGPIEDWNDDVLRGIVTTDLDRIKSYLEGDWYVLGWQNQKTVDDDKHPYAVGGGTTQLPPVVSDQVQNTLINYAKQYSSDQVAVTSAG